MNIMFCSLPSFKTSSHLPNSHWPVCANLASISRRELQDPWIQTGLGQPEKTSEGVESSGMSFSEWPLGPVSDPRWSGCRSQLQKVWEPMWCPGDQAVLGERDGPWSHCSMGRGAFRAAGAQLHLRPFGGDLRDRWLSARSWRSPAMLPDRDGGLPWKESDRQLMNTYFVLGTVLTVSDVLLCTCYEQWELRIRDQKEAVPTSGWERCPGWDGGEGLPWRWCGWRLCKGPRAVGTELWAKEPGWGQQQEQRGARSTAGALAVLWTWWEPLEGQGEQDLQVVLEESL